MRIVGTLLVMLGVVCAVWAADVAGKWKASWQLPNGESREMVFDFKVDGEKLEGTVTTPRGQNPITDGKVQGESLSFAEIRNFSGREFRAEYRGKVSGNEIQFKVQMGPRELDITAKRVQE